jgi:predicted DsbA family dithiol-disulfide isomerase
LGLVAALAEERKYWRAAAHKAVVCPWCAIGKAHLDAALAEFEHAGEVEVVWRSFELDPGAPRVREGDYATMLSRKYDTLLRLAAEAGLDPDEARGVFASDAYADGVRADEDAAGKLQISAVPTFLIDGRLAVAGTQPAGTLLQVLRRAWGDRQQVFTVAGGTGDGAMCGPDGCH